MPIAAVMLHMHVEVGKDYPKNRAMLGVLDNPCLSCRQPVIEGQAIVQESR